MTAVVATAVATLGVGAMAITVRRARRPDVLARLAGAERRSWRAFWQSPPPVFTARVAEVELPVDIADAWRWWRIGVVVVTAAAGLAMGPVPAGLALAACVAAPFAAVAVLRSRALAAYDNDLVSALDAIGRGVRSGASLGQAITEATAAVRGQVGRDVQRVASDAARGTPLVDALEAWGQRRQSASVKLAVGALMLALETGGPPARVIEEVAAALRQRLQIEAEARAMGAQARLSAIVVGVAPIGFALLTTATDERNAHMLFGTPLGLVCVVLGLTLDGIGAVWMHRISESVVA